jgi:anti-anti-sigma regulatory factor
MLKISLNEGPAGRATLSAEGTLGGAWVGEFHAACDAALDSRGRVMLDLTGVSYVDRRGAELLEALRGDPRVEIASASPFVVELLKGGAA